MILQELLFPNYDTCARYDMYFRLQGNASAEMDMPRDKTKEYIHFDELFQKQADIHVRDQSARRAYYDPQAHALCLADWQRAGFDTYFNSFSIGKWRKYTCLENLSLQLELKGAFHVSLVHLDYMYTKPFEHIFCERVCQADERQTFEFTIPVRSFERGILGFRLQTLDGDMHYVYGGGYATQVDENALNPVNIAIDICTYRREQYVLRNVALLKKEIIDNPHSPLYGHLDIIISDNGKTLQSDTLTGERIHVFPNRNVGGSGGFARGLIEILDRGDVHPFTHVLVMDDDVLIHADAILRTMRLLQFIRPEYMGKTVAGAMLRLDDRSRQHECCGVWDGSRVVNLKTRLDLTDIGDILFNEKEDMANYNAWWYSCIPISKISNENLPMPIFFRYDDVEFGLRTGSDIITMNGICLWHEPFEYKYSPVGRYYEMRNALIVNSLHLPGFGPGDAAGILRYLIRILVGRYSYDTCELVFRAVEDFCKGPEFLIATDAEALHKELMALGEKLLPLDQLSVRFDEIEYLRSQKKESPSTKRLRAITLNRHLLPRRGVSVVDAALNGVKDFAGKRRVLNYDVGSNRGFVTEYSTRRLIAVLRKLVRTTRLLKTQYAKSSEAFRQAMPLLTSRDFWNDYLGL